MGFWDSLAEGGVSGLLKGAGTFAKDIRTAITGEEALTAEQKTQLLSQAAALEASVLSADLAVIQAQTTINLEEAKSDSLFKSGWRPAVGWICAAGLVYDFLARPIVPWVVTVCGAVVPPMPPLDMSTLYGLLAGMLGLGGFRMFEKVKGVASR